MPDSKAWPFPSVTSPTEQLIDQKIREAMGRLAKRLHGTSLCVPGLMADAIRAEFGKDDDSQAVKHRAVVSAPKQDGVHTQEHSAPADSGPVSGEENGATLPCATCNGTGIHPQPRPCKGCAANPCECPSKPQPSTFRLSEDHSKALKAAFYSSGTVECVARAYSRIIAARLRGVADEMYPESLAGQVLHLYASKIERGEVG